jgi:RES domain-containing protein
MSRADFPTGYVPVEAQIPDSIAVMAASDWRLRHPGLGERELGDRWLESRLSPVLQVRSAVVPQEFNYLLNPEHPDAAAVQVVAVQPFHFDPRLF